MRKILIAFIGIVTGCVLVAMPTAAMAATVTVQIGSNTQITVAVPHPTGTTKTSNNTTTSGCTATAASGSVFSPICSVQTVKCPLNSGLCYVKATIATSAVKGGGDAVGQITFTGGSFTGVINASNTCPGSGNCSATATFLGLQPGESVDLTVANLKPAPLVVRVQGNLAITSVPA